MANHAAVQCPDCGALVKLNFVLILQVTEPGQPVKASLCAFGKCMHCFKLRGDARSIRLLIDTTIQVIYEANKDGLPVLTVKMPNTGGQK